MHRHKRVVPADLSFIVQAGQDCRDRRLDPDTVGRIKCFFTSHESATSFARSESETLHTILRLSETPLTARVLH